MNQPEAVISFNLKRIREEQNLSYTQLAELTDVSKSMLRQIEIGESSPTVNTLWKIANGLGIPFTTLITPPSLTLSKIAFKDATPLLGKSKGYRLYPLINFSTQRHFELYYVEIDPDVSLKADPHTGNAEESVLVIQGALEVSVLGETTMVMANEMLQFDAGHEHRYQNPLAEMTKAFMVISYSV
ncbi:MAG: helix-turn-helix transcriptional regulator [Anaerolineales bacterium]|nr:helix-turn-helix transcriptional regulator [Anaerolineales bacterium]MCB8938061.1 helix-turn-helix transcriptional regulator [Ardenticatenaceae bacterium]